MIPQMFQQSQLGVGQRAEMPRLRLVRPDSRRDSIHQEVVEVLSASIADRIAQMIRSGRIAEARKVLEEALETGITGARLALVRELLRVKVTVGAQATDSLKGSKAFDPAQYRGCWVALSDARVVASASSLAELQGKAGIEEAALHWIPK